MQFWSGYWTAINMESREPFSMAVSKSEIAVYSRYFLNIFFRLPKHPGKAPTMFAKFILVCMGESSCGTCWVHALRMHSMWGISKLTCERGKRAIANAMYDFCVCCRAAKSGILESRIYYHVYIIVHPHYHIGQPSFIPLSVRVMCTNVCVINNPNLNKVIFSSLLYISSTVLGKKVTGKNVTDKK